MTQKPYVLFLLFFNPPTLHCTLFLQSVTFPTEHTYAGSLYPLVLDAVHCFIHGFMARVTGMKVAQEIASSPHRQSRPRALQTEQQSSSDPPIFS